MPDPENQPAGRASREKIEKLEARVAELERTVKAILPAIKNAEDELDAELMEEGGEFYGTKFD